MELWPIPYLPYLLTATAVLFGVYVTAFRGLFGEARDVQSGTDFAISEAKRRTVQYLTDLMAEQEERATPPAWPVDPIALGTSMREDRERRARKATEEQWRVAMKCSRVVDKVANLKAWESIGRLFCLAALTSLAGYFLLILFWLPKRPHLVVVLTILMWGAPVIVVVGIRAICEVVARRIRSVQEKIEEPWRV